jgi:hypothetical protein
MGSSSSFNGRLRDECLNEHLFANLNEAQSSQYAPRRCITGTGSPYKRGQLREQVKWTPLASPGRKNFRGSEDTLRSIFSDQPRQYSCVIRRQLRRRLGESSLLVDFLFITWGVSLVGALHRLISRPRAVKGV